MISLAKPLSLNINLEVIYFMQKLLRFYSTLCREYIEDGPAKVSSLALKSVNNKLL